jgi:hypothetical protein
MVMNEEEGCWMRNYRKEMREQGEVIMKKRDES